MPISLIGGRDGRDLRDVFLAADFLGHALELLNDLVGAQIDALLQQHRVRAGGDVAESLVNDRLRQHGRGGGAVTGHVVGLGGRFLEKLRAHVRERILELDLLGHGHAVMRDGRRAELLVERDVAALRTEAWS